MGLQTLADFKMVKTLGTGSFGRVLLVQGKGMGSAFQAAKIISKERVIKTRQVEHTINEKNILYCTNFRCDEGGGVDLFYFILFYFIT